MTRHDRALRRLGTALVLAAALTVPALAVPEQGYYTFLADGAGLLSEAEMDTLETKAQEITDTYGFAPYIIIVEGLNGVDVSDLALSYWDEYSLGAGDRREGSLLLMSMEDRDFDYEVWDYTNAVFDEYRYDSVREAFLGEFRRDDWYGGFTEYLDATAYYLSGEADDIEPGEDWDYYGDYVADYGGGERHEGPGLLSVLLLVVLLPCAIAGVICGGMAASMKSVRPASYAGNYVKGHPALRVKEDIFTHTTETRTKIERSHDSGGGHSGDGGGGGGHFSSSGKF